MSSLPDPKYLHPSWCSPDHCSAPDALVARGISELEVDRWLQSQHLSEPRPVGADDKDRQAEASFVFQLTKWVYEPVSDEPDQLIMTVRFVEYNLCFAVPLSGPQVRVMAEALDEYRRTWPVNGGPR